MASMNRINRSTAVALKRGAVIEDCEFAVDDEFDGLDLPAFVAAGARRRSVADSRDGSALWADAGEAPSTDYLLLF
ncbi:hypothetical protein [Rubrimonas cliftonensis]|uniref:Uncharacterized protein n=1 Tax=Rubrimonas cliftonensis TaxID=89524 RepID=A0A1H4DKY7_9RHOB|nr:hypothetical protein [Rubrimonas cliftonensis]SEA73415.1 hypothetical protein SAMN05444370_110104 [Rubrimonas cliftonensis]